MLALLRKMGSPFQGLGAACSNALSPKMRRRLCGAARSNESLWRRDLDGWYQESRSAMY